MDVLKLKAQILSSISHALIHKDKINICVNNSDLSKTKDDALSLNFVSCEASSIIFADNMEQISKNHKARFIFATTYYFYAHTPDAIGAFFWQKGRPTIIFRKKILEKLNVKLPALFDRYIE